MSFRRRLLAALAALFVFCSASIAAEITNARPTFHPSLKTASEAAAADHSLVLLVFSAEWCGPCQAMKKDTFAAKEFLEGGGALRVTDVDIDANEKIAQSFEVSGIPALALLTADGKIVSRHVGYVDATELNQWVNDGRARAKAGQWEGTAPGSKLDPFVAKAAGDGLDTNDLAHLVAMLGEPDPGERVGVAKLLLAQREQAVPALIAAVSDPYLGVRVGASDLLQQLAPDVASIDPWQPPVELSNRVASLTQWWKDTGKLPPRPAITNADPTVQGSIKAALEDLRSDNLVRRTEAMATLAGHGPAALPAVREAIKKNERTDPRLVTLLEDVRWAILISDSLERRTGGLRSALARGSSGERQKAATQLGQSGRDALDALSELANDPDPLVVENAVRALAAVGGTDVIPAMAALLKASDSNLRMTAAQALGRTKSADATKHLLTVIDDPNEVVACAALAAVDEVNANDSPFNPSPGAKTTLGKETVAGLKSALGDPRWRVRAAAVNVIGKLKVSELVPDVKKLLDDADGFVVKSTLVALSGLSAAPGTEQLVSMAKRLPALQGDAVAMMTQGASEDAVKAVSDLYARATTEHRVSILKSLARRERMQSRPLDDTWKPLVTQAMASPETRVRSAAAEVLGLGSPELAAELIAPFLADPDADTRNVAAEVVLGILAGRNKGALRSSANPALPGFGGEEEFVVISGALTKVAKTNQVVATKERMSLWHSNLLQHAEAATNPVAAALLFALGESKEDLARLSTALEKADEKAGRRLASSAALTVVLPKLPWPESKPLLEKLTNSPLLFVLAVAEHDKAKPDVAHWFFDPARFRSVVERAGGEELSAAVQRLLYSYQYGNRTLWSLHAPDARTRQLVTALRDSTNAVWRAAALWVLTRRTTEGKTEVFAQALKDSNPWVRATALQGVARLESDRTVLELKLGPFVSDPHARTAEVAALALLEPQLRAVAGLQWYLGNFQFNEIHASSSEGVSINEDRPIAVLESKPGYLAGARSHLLTSNGAVNMIFALLLAQHGEFDGLDRLLARQALPEAGRPEALSDVLLAGIGLTHDKKYLPYLRQAMDRPQQDWDLRKILRALKGMSGPEVRQLRVDVNKRMRNPAAMGIQD